MSYEKWVAMLAIVLQTYWVLGNRTFLLFQEEG
jgi:hypothetical protein